MSIIVHSPHTQEDFCDYFKYGNLLYMDFSDGGTRQQVHMEIIELSKPDSVFILEVGLHDSAYSGRDIHYILTCRRVDRTSRDIISMKKVGFFAKLFDW